MTNKVTGGCHCGAIKYQAIINPEKVLICHCTDCQKISGTAFRTVVMSEPDQVTFTQGQPKEYIKIAQSGNQRAQGFCVDCGSGLYATSVGDEPRIYGLRLGAVDQRENFIPKAQIWCQSAQPWIEKFDSMKKFEQTPK